MIDPELLKSLMMGDYGAALHSEKDRVRMVKTKKKLETIDLHVRKLFNGIIPANPLQSQIKALEEHLDMATKTRLHEVIVIHGKGDSVLMKEVHRLLKNHWAVRTYMQINDAPYFGGSTRVVLK